MCTFPALRHCIEEEIQLDTLKERGGGVTGESVNDKIHNKVKPSLEGLDVALSLTACFSSVLFVSRALAHTVLGLITDVSLKHPSVPSLTAP